MDFLCVLYGGNSQKKKLRNKKIEIKQTKQTISYDYHYNDDDYYYDPGPSGCDSLARGLPAIHDTAAPGHSAAARS